MDQPPSEILDNCLQLLDELKCLDTEERITEYGLEVSKIPLAPALSHLLIQSVKWNCSGIMLNVLSILSIDNIFYANKEDKEEKNSTVL